MRKITTSWIPGWRIAGQKETKGLLCFRALDYRIHSTPGLITAARAMLRGIEEAIPIVCNCSQCSQWLAVRSVRCSLCTVFTRGDQLC